MSVTIDACPHVWMPGVEFMGRMVCQYCGIAAFCRTCERERGHDVVNLPHLYCQKHAPSATSQAFSLHDIAPHLIALARQIPLDRWQAGENQWRQIHLSFGYFQVQARMDTSVSPTEWTVSVVLESQRSPVFLARGPEHACTMKMAQVVGRWVQDVLAIPVSS
jgi:hypothetical protein